MLGGPIVCDALDLGFPQPRPKRRIVGGRNASALHVDVTKGREAGRFLVAEA